uniref:Uncharacterized protein n=1 Tax=viral metagenome TaxID=1070528 RepID=A0A6C0HIJ2_9ZZZZ
MNNQKMPTRSTTQPDAIFYELPNKKPRKRSTTPPPTPLSIPSAPLKPMRLIHPDTIEPIVKSLFTWGKVVTPPVFVPRKLDDEFVLDPLSSEEWMKNKLKKDDGLFVYMCGKPNPNSGRKCTCATHDTIGLYSGCIKHYMWEENLNKYMDF